MVESIAYWCNTFFIYMPFCYEQTSPLGVSHTPSGNPKPKVSAQFLRSEQIFLFLLFFICPDRKKARNNR